MANDDYTKQGLKWTNFNVRVKLDNEREKSANYQLTAANIKNAMQLKT